MQHDGTTGNGGNSGRMRIYGNAMTSLLMENLVHKESLYLGRYSVGSPLEKRFIVKEQHPILTEMTGI